MMEINPYESPRSDLKPDNRSEPVKPKPLEKFYSRTFECVAVVTCSTILGLLLINTGKLPGLFGVFIALLFILTSGSIVSAIAIIIGLILHKKLTTGIVFHMLFLAASLIVLGILVWKAWM
jgi:hypothetical protein